MQAIDDIEYLEVCMKGVRVIGLICLMLMAALAYKAYTLKGEKYQDIQTVQILENCVEEHRVTAICAKDSNELKKGDICELYLNEDTTIRKTDGSVSTQEDLKVGETVRMQYACSSLKYRTGEQRYSINRVAFLLKAEQEREESYVLTSGRAVAILGVG